MKVCLASPIRSFTGEILKDGASDLLLRAILLAALSRSGKTEQSLESKAKEFELGVKIATVKEDCIDLDSGEIQILKSLVNSQYSSLIVGQVSLLLEGKSTGIHCSIK